MVGLRLSLILSLLLAGCNFATVPQGGASPTVEQIALTAFATDTPSLTPSLTATADTTSGESPIVESATPTFTAGPPTLPPPPTPTLGPYEHTIKQGETLGFIIQLYGYRDFGVIDEIVRINENVRNADSLPGEGAIILVPRQTTTPTPEGTTPSPLVAIGPGVAPTSPATGLNVDAPIIQHIVVEGQTIVDIAVNYGTTLEVLAVLNPDISFAGCNFEVQSGGPSCNPLLQVGQMVMAPGPTPTPTLSPTPSGSETPTLTPTYAAPRIISPPQGAVVPAGIYRLEWVSAGVLQAEEVYLVQITDTTTGSVHHDITRSTSLLLPDSLIPQDGQTHIINWTVTVARPNADGVYRVISGPPEQRAFEWRSR